MGTITSANSKLVMSIPDVFPVDVAIEGYAMDDAFLQAAFDVAETRMGVDGTLSAGFTPNAKPFEISLQPDSPSVDIFDAWITAEESVNEKYVADTATLIIPSTGKQYTFTVGWLKNVVKLPPGKKVLDPQKYTIEWEDIQVSPYLGV